MKALASELEHSTSAIIGTFKALTASKDFDLRKTVRAAGGSYHVVKNKLAAKASQGTKIEAALQGLKGVSSVAYTSGDPVALAKALSTWVKENAEFTFKLGIVDGKVISVEEVKELANMPGKEELFSKLLFLIQSPAQRLATVINATGRDLAVVLGHGCQRRRSLPLARLRLLRLRKPLFRSPKLLLWKLLPLRLPKLPLRKSLRPKLLRSKLRRLPQRRVRWWPRRTRSRPRRRRSLRTARHRRLVKRQRPILSRGSRPNMFALPFRGRWSGRNGNPTG